MSRFTLACLVTMSLTVTSQAEELRVLGWNVESGGNSPAKIAEQLKNLDSYDIVGLTEVQSKNFKRYANAIGDGEEARYRYVASVTGKGDRLMIIYNTKRLSLNGFSELFNHKGTPLNDPNWGHRSPLVAHFYDRDAHFEFLFLVNHLARGNDQLRKKQAEGLRKWVDAQSLPVVAVGDYNFDYHIPTAKGNASFDEFLVLGIWKWVKPDPMVDTNWGDNNGDGKDDYPDSILDFVFVAKGAKDWPAVSKVIVRDGDFPDDGETSDHRPIEAVFTVGN